MKTKLLLTAGAVILFATLVGFIGLILIIAYLGFVPGVSDAMKTSTPRDLGVEYAEQDYRTALEKISEFRSFQKETNCTDCNESSESRKIELTQEEVSASLNAVLGEKAPMQDMQVKFNDDGTFEASGFSKEVGLPIYAKGKIVVNGPQDISLDFENVEAGRLGIGSLVEGELEEYANTALQEAIANNPNLDLERLEIEDGKIILVGGVPY